MILFIIIVAVAFIGILIIALVCGEVPISPVRKSIVDAFQNKLDADEKKKIEERRYLYKKYDQKKYNYANKGNRKRD